MESKTILDFGGGLSLAHTVHGTEPDSRVSQYGSLHRLTPEQFDALTLMFTVTDQIRTLETDGRYSSPRTFRTSEIDFGGLRLSLFADVPAEVADPDQLTLI